MFAVQILIFIPSTMLFPDTCDETLSDLIASDVTTLQVKYTTGYRQILKHTYDRDINNLNMLGLDLIHEVLTILLFFFF